MRPTPKQRGVNVPDGIEVVCRRALAVDPRSRFASIGELWAALVAARRASVPEIMGPGTPSGGSASASPPSAFAQTALPPTKPSQSAGPGVFIPSGALLGPPTPPLHSPLPSPPLGPPPMGAPGYPPTHPSAQQAPYPPMSVLHGAAPMIHHPSQMSPPPMTGPPGARMVPRMPRAITPSSNASLPVILAVIGLVVGVMFMATCGALHAACN